MVTPYTSDFAYLKTKECLICFEDINEKKDKYIKCKICNVCYHKKCHKTWNTWKGKNNKNKCSHCTLENQFEKHSPSIFRRFLPCLFS
jgi:hypothetical protein